MSDGDEEFDVWDDFRGEDREPIGTSELGELSLSELPEDASVWVMDNYFPDTFITRDGDVLVCRIEEHIYTKFWQHKFSAYAFSHAMERSVRRMIHEDHPFANPDVDDEDVHIYVRWDLRLPKNMSAEDVAASIKTAYDLVYARADSILENSDSVLVLGKDTGPSLDLLKRIAAHLEKLGYYAFIIKDQPDKLGEAVVQKVMRYALTCKFVIIENTESSGHLYEIPHVTKSAECISAVLQETGKGATWMFEDAFFKHRHWKKFDYDPGQPEQAVEAASQWAEDFVKQFGSHQQHVLPWMKPKPTS